MWRGGNVAGVPPLAAPLLTAGYHGPPELTLGRAFTSWTLDLPVLIVALLAAYCYLTAARRIRTGGQPWPAIRPVFFVGLGLGLLIVATMSWIGVYQNVLFWVRSVQTVFLLLLVPLFLALGRPLTLVIAALPRSAGSRIEAALRGRAARILTFPLVTAAVLITTPFLLYFTGWYAAAFQNDLVRELTYVALIAPGFLFFWTLLRVDPVPREYPYLVSLWITGAEVVFDAFLGIAVIADQSLIAGTYYRALARPWGPSLRTDQVLGGGALWILGDLVGLPFLAAMLIQMIKEDEAEAAEIDAALDARDAAASAPAASAPAASAPAVSLPAVSAPAAAASAGSAADSAVSNPVGGANTADNPGAAGDTPWWETDPRFAGRFKSSRPSSGRE
jgi:cytochrome c oxidase assembly factor CtaG